MLNEKKIQEKAESANDEESLMKYHVSIDSEKIQLEWRKLDNIIEEKLKNVLAKIEESDKNSSWYSVLNKIYDTYTFKFTGEDLWFPCRENFHNLKIDIEQVVLKLLD